MLLKAEEAAKLLAVRPARLYEMARTGVIPSVKLGEKSVRFSDEALRSWIDRGGVAQSESGDTPEESASEDRAA